MPLSFGPDTILDGRFRISSQLTDKPRNQVYLAIDEHADIPHRPVIVKVAGLNLSSWGERVRASLELESEHVTLELLRRHDIPAPFPVTFWQEDEVAFLVTRYIPGRTLDKRRHISPRQAVALAIELAHTLDALHRLGFVHHDVKPANIVLRRELRRRGETPMLIDYGAARRHSPRGIFYPERIGTIDYMSTSQLRGEALPGHDVYALAKTLAELIARPAWPLDYILRRALDEECRVYERAAHFGSDLTLLFKADALVGSMGLSLIAVERRAAG